ncbi:MAG: LL-diaminopimelate aminotransferase [Helicobacter sp.]|uniref:LL-diaminopimelate aminotransferase n=1 Tax=Helicobacter sp. 10-6591 TaxID=2004998 RepID=UPI000DCB8639|nr:LL-diaminopimelate aminotransferase [Helicobacter sp. 10-6591]MCI6217647.1 LL-diaminopimelate aminotransferase [Helicobacter sp.]MCI7484506.1 LL-diaminopimelate aminotransferase [Helicobacter sp.]MDD7567074.1 LL-diaminopimelate aminotransferase [Helicobacter sp.]MDY5739955.1 LL-diaminopimelate aminotransferase [Helicobacter sp.]RAX55546.1 alanine transaminase [Helicobacter sp. 10-6591]
MFDEIQFEKTKRLPKYVFAAINEIKLQMRHNNEDVIDFSMGNPDGPTPQHIIDKLCQAAQKPKNHGYSVSKGIYKLRLAICDWYKLTYGVILDPNTQACVTMGSKEGYAHLIQAITNPGDTAIVAEPAYPIHSYAFILNGANVVSFPIKWNDKMELDETHYFDNLIASLHESTPKPKFVVVGFPHNPTTTVVSLSFYERLVALAKQERFYIISDIAYAELCFHGYKAPSILQVKGAQDVAAECYTLSKTYNMAGWRVGFVVGNTKMVEALQKIKSWLDYGIYTPMQIASTIALNGSQDCVQQIKAKYQKRMEVLIRSFKTAGWEIQKPQASMFVWAKIPECAENLGSVEFSKRLLQEAKIAVSPGVGFGHHGEGYVRIALIENENRIRQAARNLKNFLKQFK